MDTALSDNIQYSEHPPDGARPKKHHQGDRFKVHKDDGDLCWNDYLQLN